MTKAKTETRAETKTRRPRRVAPAKHTDQLIILADTETGAKVRALAVRTKSSISEILREVVDAGWSTVEKRYPPAELTGPQKASRTKAAKTAAKKATA